MVIFYGLKAKLLIKSGARFGNKKGNRKANFLSSKFYLCGY